MRVEKVLVATDFSDQSKAAMRAAGDVARQLGATLMVLHVQDSSSLRIAIREGLLAADSTDEHLDSEVERLNRSRLSSAVSDLSAGIFAPESASLRGDPKALIPQFARSWGADLIVVGTQGAGGIRRIENALLGSVAESVIRKSPCPVLVVRPEHVK